MADQATPEPIDPLAAWQSMEIRIGTVRSARPNEKARVPAWVLEIDLGPLGQRVSSAQLTEAYRAEDLIGRQVAVVCSLPPRRVAGIRSEVLVLGAVPETGDAHFATVLLGPEQAVPDGSRVA